MSPTDPRDEAVDVDDDTSATDEPDEPDDPYQAEPDDHLATGELTDEDGDTYVIRQEPVGKDNVVGGGEFPDPATPPRSPAPGAASPD